MDGVSPYLTDETVVKEKQSLLVDTSILTVVLSSLYDTIVVGYFPPLFTPITTTADNAPGKSSYANVTGKPSGNKLNIRTLFTPGGSSYARVMIELRADVELKDNIVVAMSKIAREGHYTCGGEKKTVRKPSQTSRVDNDVEFGTNGGTTNLVNNEATSSRSSFMNIDNDREFASNTPIGEKINKIKRQIYEGKLMLLDNDENPLVPMGIVESNSKVEVVFDETANLRISTSGKDGS
nr:hypothetical protein [Tanacetum cinerariifolium]